MSVLKIERVEGALRLGNGHARPDVPVVSPEGDLDPLDRFVTAKPLLSDRALRLVGWAVKVRQHAALERRVDRRTPHRGERMSNGSHSLASRRVLGLVVVVACVARPIGLSAQLTTAIDLSSRSARPSANIWQSQLAVSPFLRWDHPRLALDARWTAASGDAGRVSGFGNLGATYFSPTRAGLQLSVAGFADRTLLNETFAVSRFGADSRLSYRSGGTGAWVGREVSGDNRRSAVSPVPNYSAGAWRQWGNAMVTFSLSSFGSREGERQQSVRFVTRPAIIGQPPSNAADSATRSNLGLLDTITVVDSGSAGRRRDWRDAQLGLRWGAGRVAFQGLVGTRFSTTNQPNETWGQVQGSLALAPDVALIAAGGVHPSSAAYGIARARFMELGVRLSPTALRRPRLPSGVRPSAAAFQIDEAGRGQRTLRVRVPDARSVELSADFTGWKPIALTRNDADQWEATLPITPGLHRLTIRVDGDSWTIPPGVVSVPDEFHGTVGVIIVK